MNSMTPPEEPRVEQGHRQEHQVPAGSNEERKVLPRLPFKQRLLIIMGLASVLWIAIIALVYVIGAAD
jgi:hypothetical protein